ncbi:hypothetical protein BPNPMPFG_002473 [Mesorhizobium sp. AR07]|uniref:hypothetical protein n=1 Tax=Mesorhizobium sp. AR07 TaxID=2865838 RepID=UPI00215EA751|nr:hypothetical protein [Mesorhizobium sp. AR07]UVK46765.1 hypothetical protein BPNPMPFG_002473 [Mesorhizobium sp. AR07]
MAKYFYVANGLRGCYMPDSFFVIKCDTRRELKSALEYEAVPIRDAGFVGFNRRAVASLAAGAWREAQKRNPSIYPHVAAYGQPGNACMGLHVSTATRADFLEYSAEA